MHNDILKICANNVHWQHTGGAASFNKATEAGFAHHMLPALFVVPLGFNVLDVADRPNQFSQRIKTMVSIVLFLSAVDDADGAKANASFDNALTVLKADLLGQQLPNALRATNLESVEFIDLSGSYAVYNTQWTAEYLL